MIFSRGIGTAQSLPWPKAGDPREITTNGARCCKAEGCVQPVPGPVEHDDHAHLRRHPLVWPDEQPRSGNAEYDDAHGKRDQQLTSGACDVAGVRAAEPSSRA
jgi:hypothetical protein